MQNWNTCFYIYHVEVDELQLGLNNMCRHHKSLKVCTHHEDEVCAPCNALYKGTTSLWESIICSKKNYDEWHIKECFYGKCTSCGMQKLQFCGNELNGLDDWVVQWRHYALEEIRSRNGKGLKTNFGLQEHFLKWIY